jgi:HK97 gp10 family phage protein
MAAFPTGVLSGFGGRTPRDIVLLSVRGDKAIIKKLMQFRKKDAKQIIMRSARTAMKQILTAAKSGAPVKSGKLRKAIKLRALKRNRRGNIGVRVALSDQWFVGKEFYGAFQEFGHHIGKRDNKLRTNRQWHGIGTEQDDRKWVEGQHFMEAAYINHGQFVMKRFLDEVPKQIELKLGGG